MIRVTYIAKCYGCRIEETRSVEGSSINLHETFNFQGFATDCVRSVHAQGWVRDAQGEWFCEDCVAMAAEAKA
jgi:hypothetical protein